jgi:hypothetical protein
MARKERPTLQSTVGADPTDNSSKLHTKADELQQRQSTLDCRYLTLLLCDNLKKRMFLPKLFFLPLFWEFVMFFQCYPHHSTILQPKQFH